VGWPIDSKQDATLVANALDTAIRNRRPEPGGIVHADHGTQFWSSMQIELLNRKKRETRVELANAIFEYIEIFHNRRRRHSALGYRTPIEYELLSENHPITAVS
jgi:putative transposase